MTAMAFLVLMVAITAAVNPFLNPPLNTLEQLSLFSQAITVYCGIFFISNAFDSDNCNTFIYLIVLVSMDQ